MSSSAALDRLLAARVGAGAPSARNLLVTVFGDALRPHGDDVAVSVRSLAALLAPFEVNERSVRTSLSRLVRDGLLSSTTIGRRSFYGVAAEAGSLFQQADARIYGPRAVDWDGSWTLVLIDATESTARRRAELRQRLTWAGLNVVAPNVMASPIVSPDEVAGVVHDIGGFSQVLVTRSQVYESDVTLGGASLAERSATLVEVGAQHRAFIEQFDGLDRDAVEALTPERAFQLRTLLVAMFRRTALIEPLIPAELVPDGWVGTIARTLAGSVYSGCVDAAERHLADVAELSSGAIVGNPARLRTRFR